MSKIDVGVGEDFPVDEQSKPEVEDLGTCRSRHEARRQAWRRFKHQMHEEWHAHRRAFRDAVNDRDPVEALHDRRLHHLIVGGLAMVGLAALLASLRHRD